MAQKSWMLNTKFVFVFFTLLYIIARRADNSVVLVVPNVKMTLEVQHSFLSHFLMKPLPLHLFVMNLVFWK
jgi:hypothetical protein